jgi:hypothetical protein
MNRLSVVGAIFTSLVLGAAMNAVAQDDEHKKPEEHKQQTAQPPARQEQAQPEERRNQPQQNNNEERRQEPRQDERQMQQQQEKQQHEMQQQEKQQQRMDKQQEKMDRQQGQEQREQARPQQPMPNREQARAPHRENQRHISDHDFHAHFGREHRFHPGRMQVSGGSPQFAYSGYTFELVEVWPTDWAYDADDYYIDYFGDEYWLCSFSHPEIRLELIIIG